MLRLGPLELVLILVIVLLIFGAGKLSGLGGALGRGIRDFRTAVKEGQEGERETSEADKPEGDGE